MFVIGKVPVQRSQGYFRAGADFVWPDVNLLLCSEFEQGADDTLRISEAASHSAVARVLILRHYETVTASSLRVYVPVPVVRPVATADRPEALGGGVGLRSASGLSFSDLRGLRINAEVGDSWLGLATIFSATRRSVRF